MTGEQFLREQLQELARLLGSFRLEPSDWYLADESVFLLQGYAVQPPTQDEPARHVIHLDAGKLPWRPAENEPLEPPPGTRERDDMQRFSQDGASSLSLVPLTRHSIPITFRKAIDIGGQPIWVASLRALGKIWLGDLLVVAAIEGGMGREDVAASFSRIAQLERLAAVDWPSRDRWFGKFCSETAALLATFDEGATPVAKLNRLGRRHALM